MLEGLLLPGTGQEPPRRGKKADPPDRQQTGQFLLPSSRCFLFLVRLWFVPYLVGLPAVVGTGKLFLAAGKAGWARGGPPGLRYPSPRREAPAGLSPLQPGGAELSRTPGRAEK